MTELKKKIVVVGGGAGGLELATRLGNNLGKKGIAEVILVDRNNSHLWKPLLHEVAAGSLDDGVDALSYLAHAHNHYFNFQSGTLTHIARHEKEIHLAEIRNEEGELLVPARTIPYDILVIALGSISNDFATPGVQEHCIFLDNPAQARLFYQKMLEQFLTISTQPQVKSEVNISIVGGGATGVELSAELHNAVKQLNRYGIKQLDHHMLNVTLLEAGTHILPALPERIASSAHQELVNLGVKILTKTKVVRAESNGFYTQQGEFIQSDLMVWAAGIKVADFMHEIGGLETNRINQLVVTPYLQTTSDPTIFAIGDCASCPQEEGGQVPPRAQAAHQMASLCYSNILALLRDKPLSPYVYKDHGSLVSMSKFSTVGSLMGNLMRGSMMIEGRIARIVYVSLYRMHQVALHGYIKTALMMLVGGINRVLRPRLKLH